MTALIRGYRAKLETILNPEAPFEVRLQTEGNAVYDSCCFGVDGEGLLSDDRYMIFYNQTASPEGAVTMTGQGQPAVYRVDLRPLPASVVKLVFTVSIDGAQTMREIRQHSIQLIQDGKTCAELQMTGADFHSERAIVGIEIYRKEVWRMSVTASGFDGGLPDLLRAFGGEEAEAESTPTPAPKPAAESAPAPTPFPQKAPAPAPTPFPQQAPVTAPVTVTAPVAVKMPERAPAPSPFPAQAPAPAPSPFPAPVPVSVPVPGAVPASGPVLGSRPVNLKKGDRVDLRKHGEPPLTKVMVGLGWDAAVNGTSVDCDASAFVCKGGYLQGGRDIVCYTNLRHSSGAVVHSGDNLTGHGDGDDERIIVDLLSLPPEYDRIVFVANIFLGKMFKQHFGKVRNCFIRICDETGQELCRYILSDNAAYDGKYALIFGELLKHGGFWTFHAIGEGTTDGSISSLSKRYKRK